jgi:hypothetical protein
MFFKGYSSRFYTFLVRIAYLIILGFNSYVITDIFGLTRQIRFMVYIGLLLFLFFDLFKFRKNYHLTVNVMVIFILIFIYNFLNILAGADFGRFFEDFKNSMLILILTYLVQNRDRFVFIFKPIMIWFVLVNFIFFICLIFWPQLFLVFAPGTSDVLNTGIISFRFSGTQYSPGISSYFFAVLMIYFYLLYNNDKKLSNMVLSLLCLVMGLSTLNRSFIVFGLIILLFLILKNISIKSFFSYLLLFCIFRFSNIQLLDSYIDLISMRFFDEGFENRIGGASGVLNSLTSYTTNISILGHLTFLDGSMKIFINNIIEEPHISYVYYNAAYGILFTFLLYYFIYSKLFYYLRNTKLKRKWDSILFCLVGLIFGLSEVIIFTPFFFLNIYIADRLLSFYINSAENRFILLKN